MMLGRWVSNWVHVHLENILRYLKAKRHMQEPVHPHVGLKGGEV